MNAIFKKNALIAGLYTVVIVGVSFFFSRSGQSIILNFCYSFIALAHFMAMAILMAINHFKQDAYQRNGYMASFAFIWALMVVVQYLHIYYLVRS